MWKKGVEGKGREVSTRSSSCLRCSCSSGPLTFHAAAVLARSFFSLDLSHTHTETDTKQFPNGKVNLSDCLSVCRTLCVPLRTGICLPGATRRFLFAQCHSAGRDGGRRCVTMTLRFASHLNTDSLVFSCSALPFPLLTPCPPLILSHDFVSVACLFAILSALGCLNLLLEPLHLLLLFFLLFYFFFLLVIYATCCSNS